MGNNWDCLLQSPAMGNYGSSIRGLPGCLHGVQGHVFKDGQGVSLSSILQYCCNGTPFMGFKKMKGKGPFLRLADLKTVFEQVRCMNLIPSLGQYCLISADIRPYHWSRHVSRYRYLKPLSVVILVIGGTDLALLSSCIEEDFGNIWVGSSIH